MRNRLQNIRDALQFRILISIKKDNMHGLNGQSRKVLEDIVDSNRTLTADIHTHAHKIFTKQNFEGDLATNRHQEVLDAISAQNFKAPGVDTILPTLLSKLFSHRQEDRFEDIPQAHQETFTWALAEKDSPQKRPDLLNWLHNDNGIYWISGKAGSGKSTLMKYLVQDPRLRQALQQWAGDDELVIATFYFWRAGAPSQRSQTGLLRSLLWQVLTQQPTLGSLLFPEQYVYGAVWTEFPTFHQLRRAFNRFTNHITSSATVPTKVAFIVDGLDEFEKDVIDFTGLADIFLNSGKSPNVKALLSSRPLPAFESSFEGMPQLRLHELTHGDVAAYVEAELGPRLRLTGSPEHDSASATNLLLAEIVDAAAGVFLWVKLVVRSLVEGVENGDTTEDLRTRLRALPRDLEDLFEHMISNIPDDYKVQSSQIFQVLRTHQRLDRAIPLTAIDLWYATDWDEDSIIHAPVASLTSGTKKKIERDFDRRLKSRCVGLLELRTRRLVEVKLREDQTLEGEIHQDVVYIHRTAADYLLKQNIWAKIVSWTGETNLDTCQLLLQSLVMRTKGTELFPGLEDDESSERHLLWPLVRDAMTLAQIVEKRGRTSPSALLRELDRLVALHYVRFCKLQPDPTNYSWYIRYIFFCTDNIEGSHTPELESTHDNFLSLLIFHGLYFSVADTLSEHPQALLAKEGRPWLHYNCILRAGKCDILHPRIIQLLLESGVDPNQVFDGKSAWQHALEAHERLYDYWKVGDRLRLDVYQDAHLNWATTLMLLAKHGANPKACINGQHKQQSALQIVKVRFGSFLEGRLDDKAYRFVAGYLQCQRARIPKRTDDAESLARALSPKHKEDLKKLRSIGLSLIKFLDTKGTKKQVWRNVNGKYVKYGRFRDWSMSLFIRRYRKGEIEVETAENQGFWSFM